MHVTSFFLDKCVLVSKKRKGVADSLFFQVSFNEFDVSVGFIVVWRV